MTQNDKHGANADGQKALSAPSISLPKGGGAIHGMGEKFAANPVTGTSSVSVPLATSPGRSGFGPQLSLSYDSGAGNGPFGFGWSLGLPDITRKTDKGLPRYADGEESDVFILSGAEDLVPVAGDVSRDGHVVRRYRPRIEGLFARIERWTRDDGDVHWRSISRDNILTIYGKDANARIADPLAPLRIFSWLICETRDDKGNAVFYEYKPDDGAGIDPSRAHERNRGDPDAPARKANRYLKRIRYGNRVPFLDSTGHRPRVVPDQQIQDARWMFEAVFDYGEHDAVAPTPHDALPWTYRDDPFSSCRAGFEVRTTRLCQRVLTFHHFPQEPEVGGDCLVRSTDFTYSHEQDPASLRNPVYTFLLAVTQSGYRRQNNGYEKRSLPSVEYEYTQPVVQDAVQDVDVSSLENLPVGLDGAYQWIDLHGEGIAGILSEQAGAWFYKRNLSPIGTRPVELAPQECVQVRPQLALSAGAQFMDLAGDGQTDLVVLDGPMPGLYEHDAAEGWQTFRPFTSVLHRDLRDPHVQFVDLDGDGHADVLIAEDDALMWHASLAEEGFGPAQRMAIALDEEKGPRLLFNDRTQSIHAADLNGDGLADLARIRNGEICYWPNLGHGHFGAKVTMDNCPRFDGPDQFDPARIRLADVDGSGTTDVIYLHRDGVRLYFNQSGNGWSAPQPLRVFPRVDDLVSVNTVDLLGNGTACLVWSSSLPGDAGRQMRYVDLMGGQKPHLLVRTVNNLGVETRVQYASSTKFYLQDKRDGRPWITRLPFPVHAVERVETFDHVSRNRFVTRFAYHHGYFDGEEREFRGFGTVEQFDTETFATLSGNATMAAASNVDAASHVPPALTRTWFHTGSSAQPSAGIPDGLMIEEEREAYRALKGSMLRQEVYALDGTEMEEHPYTVTEQNFAVRMLQSRGANRHAVFFTHPREAFSHHYERRLDDPRITHSLTLEVDSFGSVLKDASVAYGRRVHDVTLPLDVDRHHQSTTFVTCTENGVTNAIDAGFADDYRIPQTCETRTYELTGHTPAGASERFQHADFSSADVTEIAYEDLPTAGRQRRSIEHLRTLFRPDDLGAAQNNPLALLPLGTLEPLAVSGESYKLAFTPGLLPQVFQRNGEPLLPDVEGVLGGEGGYVERDGHWWIPAGRVFLSPGANDTAAQELAYAREHWFLPHRYRDPFHTADVSTESSVAYDRDDLLLLETRDALGNRVTVGERLPNGTRDASRPGNDYRVLQPLRLMNPNRNRTHVAVDILGMVVGTAVMGKPEESVGDSLEGFASDVDENVVLDHMQDPLHNPRGLLGRATTRLLYDLFAYRRTRDAAEPQPAVVATLVRETHDADVTPGKPFRIQHSFAYSDGFGREIQKKIQAEPEKIDGIAGPPRWLGSGWTVFNNKGKPVRQYEPFFSATHRFELGVEEGVSPILFYDPVERVVATLHPNNTYEKVVFDPWQQTTWDVNDTVLGDPRTDEDVKGLTARYFAETLDPPWTTWHGQRQDGTMGPAEQTAAAKAAAHANTPMTTHFDALGRTFLTLAHNGFRADGTAIRFATRVTLDIDGNQRTVRDAIEQNGDPRGRIVMHYAYDLLGNRVHQSSMEAGARWTLNDVAGKPIRSWDSLNHDYRTDYDPLRRPLRVFLGRVLTERLVYGERSSEAESRNLRGKLYLHLDQAGVAGNEVHDFKGNLLRASRRFAADYKEVVDWRSLDAAFPVSPFDSAVLESILAGLVDTAHESATTYDAMNRPATLTTPHTSAMRPSIIRPGYNEANFLERIDVNLRGAVTDGEPLWTPFVTNIDHDAKGQRLRIDTQNDVSTFYEYDPLTFRLIRLLTRRNAFPDDCPQPPPPGFPGCQVQDLRYTYDPAGNITHIRDEAQQKVFFRNKRVEPSAEYRYDAIYRLIEATGREHLGQAGGAPIPHSHDDAPRMSILWSANEGEALGTYVERYVYDAVGNFLEMEHRGSDLALPGWTRSYAYGEASLLENGKTGNRLSSTTVGANAPEPYPYDAHGNMLRMPHIAAMHWDHRDQLRELDLGGGGTAYFVYDAAGQRVRKVWEKSPGLVEERLYFGAFEIFRRRLGPDLLERETLHVLDGQRRVALVETRTTDTGGDDPAPQQLTRYQYTNHLGSSTLELDEEAGIISYEEYTPYGSTSYQAVRSVTQSPKRYRYTGKERDEESGFYYHGARHYAPWLGRWTRCDPIGMDGGINPYSYVEGNPIQFVDPSGTEKVKKETLTVPAGEKPYSRNVLLDGPEVFSDATGILESFFVGGRGPKAQLRYDSLSEDQTWAKEVMDKGWGCTGCHVSTQVWNTLGPDAINPDNGLPYDWAINRKGFNDWVRLSAQARFFVEASTAVAGTAVHLSSARAARLQTATPTMSTPRPLKSGPTSARSAAPDSRTTAVATSETVTIGGSGTTPTPNRSTVGLPRPGEKPMAYGTRTHQEFPRLVSESNPGAGGRFNVAPGQTGPDLANPTGMNATFAELKSLWGRQGEMVSQARRWGYDAQTARYFFYDRNTGRVFEGIIQTEKFPSGVFRP